MGEDLQGIPTLLPPEFGPGTNRAAIQSPCHPVSNGPGETLNSPDCKLFTLRILGVCDNIPQKRHNSEHLQISISQCMICLIQNCVPSTTHA